MRGYSVPQTIGSVQWLTQHEISTMTGFAISKVRSVVQVLDAVDQIETRIDPKDGKSRLVRESDLDIIKKALNRGEV
jgi:hypothetical protein